MLNNNKELELTIAGYIFSHEDRDDYSFTIQTLHKDLIENNINIEEENLRYLIKSWVELGNIRNNIDNYSIRK